MTDNRNFEENPVTVQEAIEMFLNEDSNLALATEEVIEEASDLAEHIGLDHVASDIGSRYDDYQEELRCMLEEFLGV